MNRAATKATASHDLTDERLATILVDLYGCAIDRSRWPDVLRQLSDCIGAPQATLISHDATDGQVQTVAVFHGSDPEGINLYNQYFHRCDPWAAAFKASGGFGANGVTVVSSESLVPTSEFQRTEFYGDFGAKFRMSRNLMVTASPRKGGSATSLTFPAGLADRPYRRNARAALAVLAPHMAQALAIDRVLRREQYRAAGLAAGLDGVSRPIAVLDPDGTVQHANGPMRELLRSRRLVGKVGRRLRPAPPQARRHYERALRAFAAWNEGRLAAAAPVAIPLTMARDGLVTLHLAPVPTQERRVYAVTARVEGLSLVEADPRDAFDLRYRLTPTEDRITRHLCDGLTVSDIADRLRAKTATVRWHLKQAFAKTGARTQAQLVARVLSSPRAAANEQFLPNRGGRGHSSPSIL